jgi:D-alanine-D-alanine ligase
MSIRAASAVDPVDSPTERVAWWERWVQRKGHIGPLGIALLWGAVALTVVMACTRVLAYPGLLPQGIFGLEALRHIGNFLNQTLTLEWVPPADRHHILYLVMLPTAALIITLARLTLGLRMLGLRSILLAVGFQEIGVLPSLVLLAAVVAIVVLLRPAMQRARLPMFARISAILGLAAVIMVVALFVGPWVRSEVIWSVAFFPVIILAMMAEAISSTVSQHNSVAAAWRAGWTILVALLIAWISQNPFLREFALRFPELMFAQLAMIVLVAEYVDLRLLQDWPANLGVRAASETEAQPPERARVAVVRNRSDAGVISRMAPAASLGGSVSSVQHLVDALRETGYEVKVFEGDITLLTQLQRFLAPHASTGMPGGVVLNLATGIQGSARLAQVPAMLEMAGVAYSGPDAIGHMHALDRYLLLSVLRHAGVAVPNFKLMTHAEQDIGELEFPLAVRPRFEPDAAPLVVRNHRRELTNALEQVVQRYRQDVVVESYLNAPEIRVAVLGNGDVECLPLLQVDAAGNGKICPASVDDGLAERIRACARRAYHAAGCRDYARVDIRLTKFQEPRVVHVRSLDILARRGSFVFAAQAGGYSLRNLMQRIVESTWSRYCSQSFTPMGTQSIDGADNVLPLPQTQYLEGSKAA